MSTSTPEGNESPDAQAMKEPDAAAPSKAAEQAHAVEQPAVGAPSSAAAQTSAVQSSAAAPPNVSGDPAFVDGESAAAAAEDSGADRGRTPTPAEAHRREPITVLMIGALGVVFGDIGTSPLYALQTVFSTHHNAVAPTEGDVLGVISMVLWCLLIIVTVTYIGLIMTAHNQGEGGILALASLILRKLRKPSGREARVALVLAVIGASLFYGDSLITPAISVLSAFEGIEVASAVPNTVILPGAIIVLTLLFSVQRWGTARIGRAFGAVMILWFLVLAAMGLPHIASNPSILRAVSPTYAIAFLAERPAIAFIAMGAVVLTITGAEALYADMGHFGRRPIALAWLCLVLPSLLINYFGQGALILSDPATIINPFFSMVPDVLRIPLVVLAACATVIASQAVISGAFSVSRQATRLSLLPRLKVTQTSSEHGGQIYIGVVNGLLFLGVLILVVTFRSSERLAAAYGLAVTATIILVLALFLLLALKVWHWPLWRVVLLAVIVGGLELALLAANIVKIPAGGWLPLVIAAVLSTIMLSWRRGSRILFGRRRAMEGPIGDFITGPAAEARRVPGLAVYPHGNPGSVPLALRTNVSMNHVLHEQVVIITMAHIGVPHARPDERLVIDDLGDPADGIVHITCKVGFNDSQDVPRALAEAVGRSPELRIDPADAVYFLSVLRIERGTDDCMPRWQKALVRTLERASANRTHVLSLPPSRTVVMGAETEL